MPERRLTTPSFLVLGLVEFAGPVTPYDLKALAAESVMRFWSLPHTQIYAQCDRLVEAGLLSEKRESGGRRRRLLSITPEGKDAMAEWREQTDEQHLELRDTSLLKLFFGADRAALAADQVRQHKAMLETYEAIKQERGPLMTEGMMLSLDAGITFEREFLKFWKRLAKE